MSNCTPCTPAIDELPIFCDPYPATTIAKRLLVEDEAFCQKALTSPTAKSWLIWDNSDNKIEWEPYAITFVNKAGDAMTGPLTTNSTIFATGNSSKIGYNIGAGGSVTQGAGSKANPVTLNRPTGIIITNSTALNANTAVTFNLSNSVIEATDIVVISHISGGTLGSYNFAVAPATGNANITIRNITAGNLSEALTLRFIVIKSVNS